MPVLVGLDVGTTTIKAAALDADAGRICAVASRPTPVSHPAPGLSEHDPEALWQALAACLRELISRIQGQPVEALTMASFAEAGLPLNGCCRPATELDHRLVRPA